MSECNMSILWLAYEDTLPHSSIHWDLLESEAQIENIQLAYITNVITSAHVRLQATKYVAGSVLYGSARLEHFVGRAKFGSGQKNPVILGEKVFAHDRPMGMLDLIFWIGGPAVSCPYLLEVKESRVF